MDKRFLAIVAVIVLAFLGVVIFNRKDASAPAGDGNVQASSHLKGEGAKNVTLVEYGDFQCPVCALYEPVIQEVYEKHQQDIKFQFRHFPLQQIHENAFAASRAAEAAAKQGKFWEMHDLLFANQSSWSKAPTPQNFFEQYAQSLKLDVNKYKSDFTSENVKDIINADVAEGTKLNVSGTPSFFIDGKQLELKDLAGEDGQPSVDKFSQAIEAAIKAKQ